ncbi:amidohydrolase family protein [Actinopolymorpha pittospori]
MDSAEAAEIRLRDYKPRAMVKLPAHEVERAAAPVVDVHNHLGRWHSGDWDAPDLDELLSVMDDCNVAAIVNLDGGWEDELEANLDRYDRAYPGRFATFARLDWTLPSRPGWPELLVRSLQDSARRGAAGVKLWKDIGLHIRDENDKLVMINDERLSDMWSAFGELSLPVLIHTADPAAFFEPLDGNNERIEELTRHPDWYFGDSRFPRMQVLLDALEDVVAAHPDVTVIGAHVGCYAEDLGWVDRMLSTYPNFNVDIAARIAELGRQPRATRALVDRHPDRVLFGTDSFPPNREAFRRYFRFLETADEHFPYSGSNPPGSGRWTISGLDLGQEALRQVYGANAARLVPALRDSLGGTAGESTATNA